MTHVKGIIGWIGPIAAACLIVAPVVRFRERTEPQNSRPRAEQALAGGNVHAACPLRGGLERWCELPGCKACHQQAGDLTHRDSSPNGWAASIGLTLVPAVAQLEREFGLCSNSAIAHRCHGALFRAANTAADLKKRS